MSEQSTKRPSIPLPSGWELSNFAIHFEGEDLSRESAPFAANIISQLRTDVETGVSLEEVATGDLDVLRQTVGGFQVRTHGSVTVNNASCEQLEFTYQDTAERTLQQLTVYLHRHDHVYSVTGVHIAGDRFEAIRATIHDVVLGLLLDVKTNTVGAAP